MAITFSNELQKINGNTLTNSEGKPNKLIGNITYETINGKPNQKVINLSQLDGFFYGDLAVRNDPQTPQPFADILVSDIVDYEISFWFYQNHNNPTLEMSATCKSKYGFAKQTFDIKTNNPNSHFFRYQQNICGNPSKWIFARYILYRNDISLIEKNFYNKQPLTSTNVGTNLVMEKGTKFVNIKLINYGTSVKINNFCIKPLRTSYSTGFLNGGNFIELWRKVNNKEISIKQIDKISQQKLLPYNAKQLITDI